uniref:Thiol:disulfide interchange protein n=1 Tax=Cliftonaea pectinata TaxID=2007206 RepID=A0A1Z1MQJ1_9FLOR|nr:thiol:disulfide interchange protein [Cliftonaea pectinata]ARW68045.1 thiol:disulfide interchange protein [Cliftonaea pectinata]
MLKSFYNLYSYISFNSYELLLYSLQQRLYNIFYIPSNTLSFLILLAVFVSGVITSLSPCFLSVFPLIVSYTNSKNVDKYIFILGFVNSFLVLLFFNHLINYSSLISKIPLISFVLLVLISLNLLQILDLTYIFNLVYDKVLMLYGSRLESYLSGLFIGFTLVPCNNSIVFLVTFFVVNKMSLFSSIIYLIFYLFGFLLPLIILFNINVNYGNFYNISWILDLIFPLGGTFLFSFSLLSILKILFI